MKRYLFEQILKGLQRKMVFITGPRQVGKTYLSKWFDDAEFIQLVHNLHNEEDNENIQIRRAGDWLRELEV